MGGSDFVVSSIEAERLKVWEMLSWLGLRGRETDSKLDSPEDWAASARRSLFFFGGSFSVGSWAKVWLR